MAVSRKFFDRQREESMSTVASSDRPLGLWRVLQRLRSQPEDQHHDDGTMPEGPGMIDPTATGVATAEPEVGTSSVMPINRLKVTSEEVNAISSLIATYRKGEPFNGLDTIDDAEMAMVNRLLGLMREPQNLPSNEAIAKVLSEIERQERAEALRVWWRNLEGAPVSLPMYYWLPGVEVPQVTSLHEFFSESWQGPTMIKGVTSTDQRPPDVKKGREYRYTDFSVVSVATKDGKGYSVHAYEDDTESTLVQCDGCWLIFLVKPDFCETTEAVFWHVLVVNQEGMPWGQIDLQVSPIDVPGRRQYQVRSMHDVRDPCQRDQFAFDHKRDLVDAVKRWITPDRKGDRPGLVRLI